VTKLEDKRNTVADPTKLGVTPSLSAAKSKSQADTHTHHFSTALLTVFKMNTAKQGVGSQQRVLLMMLFAQWIFLSTGVEK